MLIHNFEIPAITVIERVFQSPLEFLFLGDDSSA